jgi:hypothetical protein
MAMATLEHEVDRRRQVQDPTTKRGLAGSVVKEVGDPFGTGERWDADAS